MIRLFCSRCYPFYTNTHECNAFGQAKEMNNNSINNLFEHVQPETVLYVVVSYRRKSISNYRNTALQITVSGFCDILKRIQQKGAEL